MILKAFKRKSNEKYLNNVLSVRNVHINNTKIESLGIIINTDEVDGFEQFKDLAANLNVRANKVKVIAFSKEKKEIQNSWDSCFNHKDLGWKGTIKNVELKAFLNTEFDTLISYYFKDALELKLFTAMSRAHFKIGVLQTDARLNDLIIKTNLKEFNVFKKEIIKYLTILNKI